MKRRLLPLLLALLLLFSACGSTTAKEEEITHERALENGTYALYDENDELTGYLEVSSRRLIRYDAAGDELQRISYRYNAREDRYTDDDGEEFTVSSRKRGLVLRLGDERFTLSPSVLPGPGTPSPSAAPVTEAPAALDAEEIYALALSASVDVTAYLSDSYYATGSGFFYDNAGTVITNYHVIENAYEATITTSDGKEYLVNRVLAWDKDRDIAVLETDCPVSVALTRRAAPARAGETVYAFGSPLGFSATISDGIVSNAAREYEGQLYIQHTAPISHGNSGGPLLDAEGNVLGIVCAYFSGGQNLNLAIPVADVESLDRSSAVTLVQMFGSPSGSGGSAGSSDPVWDSDWDYVCIASDLGWDLYAQMPAAMSDNVEVNETYTGLSASMESDEGYYIHLGADILDAHGEDISNLDYGELSELINESIGELTSDYTTTSTTVVISDVEWTIFLAWGTVEDKPISNYLFVTPTPDNSGMFMVNIMTFSYDQPHFDAGEEVTFELLNSLLILESD